MRQLLAKLNINLPPMPASPPTHAPDRQTLIQLGAVIAIALILHFSIAKSAIAIFSCVVYAIKCLIIWRKSKGLPQWVVMLLTVTSIGLIINSYGGWNGQTAGISFLVLLVSLKFLESHTVRDYFIVCLILYFLAASSFLFNSSLPNIILVIAYTTAITALLFKITNPASISAWSALKSSSGLILKSIPLALFLFFFFPRVQGSFGFLPSLDQTSNSLENSLVAGDMASNAFSNELAFKARFDGPIPPTSRLYWRSKVMNEEVNFAWQISDDENLSLANQRSAKEMRELAKETKGQTYYDILHEPSRDAFLPYLDFVTSYSIGTLGHDYSVRRRIRGGSFVYQGASTLAPYIPTEAPNFDFLTTTESQPTARLQALISSFRRNANTDLELAMAAYNHFANNEYNYSLSPPGLEDDTPLDDFLFNTRTGYCEHYASAFTTLLRWLNIPSRVVVGYHGGTVNRAGNFVEVRYSDAHAWSEAYIDGTWMRFDPTATISPERIEFGMDAIRELWENDLLDSNNRGNALTDFLNPTGTALVWKNMVETWSNVQYQWKKWVVEYDFETQQELLSKFGLHAKNSLYSLLLILSTGVFGVLIFYFWQLIPKSIKRTELQRLYMQFIAKAKKAGVDRNLSDTPSEFANKVIRSHPYAKTQIELITRVYLNLCYRAPTDKSAKQLETLKNEIKKLKLKRSKLSNKLLPTQLPENTIDTQRPYEKATQ